MKFSFVIPTLNEERCLPLLLTSITQQTLKNFEVIVVDAHSRDNTQQAVKEFSAQLPGICMKTVRIPNLPAQRNLGGFTSIGEWIVFVDADSVLSPRFLEEISGYVEHHPRSEVITTWCMPDSHHVLDKLIVNVQNSLTTIGSILNRYIAHGSLSIIRSQTFRGLGGYNESYQYAEDIELSHRLISQNIPLSVIRKPLYTISLRRYRTKGYINVLSTYAMTLYTSFIIGRVPASMRNYAMGGHNYRK